MNNPQNIAKEISQLLPTFMRHMFPYVFQPIGLPPSQIIALVSIQERKGCTLGELKKEMHVSAPTVTGIISRLERDGYVKRVADRKDRRVIRVELLSKGEKIIQKFRDNIRKRWEYILSRMPSAMAEVQLEMMRNLTQGFIDGKI